MKTSLSIALLLLSLALHCASSGTVIYYLFRMIMWGCMRFRRSGSTPLQVQCGLISRRPRLLLEVAGCMWPPLRLDSMEEFLLDHFLLMEITVMIQMKKKSSIISPQHTGYRKWVIISSSKLDMEEKLSGPKLKVSYLHLLHHHLHPHQFQQKEPT